MNMGPLLSPRWWFLPPRQGEGVGKGCARPCRFPSSRRCWNDIDPARIAGRFYAGPRADDSFVIGDDQGVFGPQSRIGMRAPQAVGICTHAFSSDGIFADGSPGSDDIASLCRGCSRGRNRWRKLRRMS